MPKLRYAVTIKEGFDHRLGKYYIASHPELDGLIGTGKTIEEARTDLFSVRKDLIKILTKDKVPFPKARLKSN